MNVRAVLKTAAKWLEIAAFWLLVWYIAYLAVDNSLLLPSPTDTLRRLWLLSSQEDMWSIVGMSLLRITAGFASGMLIGCLLGAVTAVCRLLRDLFKPLMVMIKSTPVASFIILALVLIPTGAVPSFTVMLIVIPVFWANVYSGILAVDGQLLEMAQVFRMKPAVRLHRIYVPSVLPYFTGAVTSGIGLAWKAGIAAEVICVTRDSIGKGLYQSKIYLETESLFAWTTVVIILSLILENIVTALINAAVRKARFSAADKPTAAQKQRG